MIRSETSGEPLRITIICGSHRPASNSRRAGELCADILRLRDDVASVELFDLADEHPLPFMTPAPKEVAAQFSAAVAPMKPALEACDAVIAITPEWSGMASATIKNFFLGVGHLLAHKPGMILSVSSGTGGSYPVAELRMSSYKNSHICWTPNHTILWDVEQVLAAAVAEADGGSRHEAIDRLHNNLNVLCAYGHALRQVRASGADDLETFPFGA